MHNIVEVFCQLLYSILFCFSANREMPCIQVKLELMHVCSVKLPYNNEPSHAESLKRLTRNRVFIISGKVISIKWGAGGGGGGGGV